MSRRLPRFLDTESLRAQLQELEGARNKLHAELLRDNMIARTESRLQRELIHSAFVRVVQERGWTE